MEEKNLQNNNCCRKKAQPRSEESVRKLENRINRMIGQLGGIRTMVQERIDGVVSGVKRVAVTDDPTIYATLEKLGDSLDGAVNLDDIRKEIDSLFTRIGA